MAPNPYAHRSVAVDAAWFQLPCLQPGAGPCDRKPHFTFGGLTMNPHARLCVLLIPLFALAPASAQWVNPDTCSMAEFSCQQAKKDRDNKSAGDAQSAQIREEREQHLRAYLKAPPLPAERNVLLGTWRRDSGGQQSVETNAGLMKQFLSNPTALLCELRFGSGITFTPSTFSMSGLVKKVEGPIEYRSGGKQAIVAIVVGRQMQSMFFEIASPNRIVEDLGSCALVRVGATAANAAGNAMTAPGNARTAAASPSLPPTAGAMPQVAAVAPAPPPRSTLARPSREVCANTLLDQLGKVGTNQVRAMSDVRFKEMAIEGKVPNTNNRRIDLRGSACDDPRIKATLYDFDANEMLQSITYVWDRPAGPAPAAIFQERVSALSRFHALPPPQSPGRLQADTSLGRLILQDLPERNLLLEAYAAKK
jgi:hypothetical protein